MIALCRAKCWIVQLKEREADANLPFSQEAFRGYVITYPQNPQPIAQVLPPSIEDIVTPICVIFIGSSPPSKEWICTKAKPLTVRADHVRAALIWLKAHNPLYNDIVINESVLSAIENGASLPFHVEHIQPHESQDTLQSRYDSDDISQSVPQDNEKIPFDNVVIADVNGHASADELRAAALRHLHDQGGGYIQIPHGGSFVNEFKNTSLFPSMYPTLFPFGIGGLEDSSCPNKLSFQMHVKHLMNLADRR
ncbi:hypothetical protein BDZ94DRAFT_1166171 [Collybia nuda]|uniref:DUF6570 domain-containing protein n=1 Tax=Collybia nuda TaxID=64659 RepID=A0A9P6CIW9_9AGAR|nr:hypothetical protein BDZ94DRAFT_1166171 [Collybia nuda]